MSYVPKVLIATLCCWLSIGAPALAHSSHRGERYTEALAAKRAAARAARLADARESAERAEARQIAYFSGLYGPNVGRWYPLVHRYFPGHVRDAFYVMRGESGGSRTATNGACRGLYQLHQCHAAKFLAKTGLPYFWGVFDAKANIRFAAYMSNGGTNWSAWSVRP